MAERAAPDRHSKVTSIDSQKRHDNGPKDNGSKEEEHAAAKQDAPTAVQPVEPEDAYLTGGSRSLQRRLLGLNVEGSHGQARPHPDATAPGLHSTGSYTEDESGKHKE